MMLLVPLRFPMMASKLLNLKSLGPFSVVLSFTVFISVSVLSSTTAFVPISPTGVGNYNKVHAYRTGAPRFALRQLSTRHFYRANKNEEGNDNENKEKSENDKPSWYLPSNKPESSVRRERLIRTYQEMQRFTHDPKELKNLRSDIASLKDNLKWALATDDIHRAIDLTNAIEKAQKKDPEVVYSKLLQKIKDAQRMHVSKKYKVLPKYMEEAMIARKYIPRLNMEGLWLGNFGSDGSGLVNVTYTGDTLVATNVGGEGCSFSKGDVLFRADLFPIPDGKAKDLPPIQLTGSAASKWGTDKLERYSGEGKEASRDPSQKEKFEEGQLIMFDGYFSFLYLPSKRHVFFSRPSSELVLEMMRSIVSVTENEVESMKEHIEICFEKEIEEPSYIKSKSQRRKPWELYNKKSDEYKQFLPNYSENNEAFSFLSFHRWMNYIDTALKSPKTEED